MNNSYWIWYPGDMELYYGMKQNFSRVERGYGWPAFWKSEGFRNRVVFRRTYELEKETEFCVYSRSIGYVLAGDQKFPFGQTISCGPGEISDRKKSSQRYGGTPDNRKRTVGGSSDLRSSFCSK